MRAALRAEAFRLDGPRRLAAECVCLDSASRDVVVRDSRLRAFETACERFRDVALRPPETWPAAASRSALCRVATEVVPGLGGGRSTPARRAFDKPMAMACLVDRAPCFPSRTCSISSRTNSPACVLGALP